MGYFGGMAKKADKSCQAQFQAKVMADLKANEEAAKAAKELSRYLSSIIPDDAEWEQFWAPIPENVTNAALCDLLSDEIARRQGPKTKEESND
jgi:hypothetical protein